MLYHCYRNRCTIVTENDASLLLILMYSILPKMMYFSLPITARIRKKWTQPVQNWGQTAQQLAILFPDRFRILA